MCSCSDWRTRRGTPNIAWRRMFSSSMRMAGTSAGCSPPIPWRKCSVRMHAAPWERANMMKRAARATRTSTPNDHRCGRNEANARPILPLARGAAAAPAARGTGAVGTVSGGACRPVASRGITCVRWLAFALSAAAVVARPSRKLRRSATISPAVWYRWAGWGDNIFRIDAASPASQDVGSGASGSVRLMARASVALLSPLMYW